MTLQRLLTLMVVAVCLSQPALAQINPFRGSGGTPLNRGDIAALTDATYRLLDQPQLVAGASETWSSPQSGVSGTVTAGSAVKRHGLACRVVQVREDRAQPHREPQYHAHPVQDEGRLEDRLIKGLSAGWCCFGTATTGRSEGEPHENCPLLLRVAPSRYHRRAGVCRRLPLSGMSAPDRRAVWRRRVFPEGTSPDRRCEHRVRARRPGRAQASALFLPALRHDGVLVRRRTTGRCWYCVGCLRRSVLPTAHGIGVGGDAAFLDRLPA